MFGKVLPSFRQLLDNLHLESVVGFVALRHHETRIVFNSLYRRELGVETVDILYILVL